MQRWTGGWAVAGGTAAVVAAGFLWLLADRTAVLSSRPIASAVLLLPRAELTPGTAVPVTNGDVCGADRRGTQPIPVAVRQRVFESYGADYRRSAESELDYLITPELGGTSEPAISGRSRMLAHAVERLRQG